MQRFSFLAQLYPYYYTRENLPKLGGILFLLAFGFVYLFKPFNVEFSEHKMHHLWICLIHAGTASLIFELYFTIRNIIGIKEENWTIRKEILNLGLVLVLIGLGNFLIRDLVYENPYNWSPRYLFEEVRNTFLVGLLLILILVPLNFMRVYSRNERSAARLDPTTGTGDLISGKNVHITTKVKADDFMLIPEKLLFARAEGNYVEFQFEDNRKLLKRLTIKELEEQLRDFPLLIKTHRSYIVNSQKITKISGNAQGYKLKLENHSSTIPVARSMISKFDNAVNRATL